MVHGRVQRSVELKDARSAILWGLRWSRCAGLLVFGMKNELDIVRDVSMRLESAGIDYMLTGSMAMNFYAQPRMTRNIDLVLALTSNDAARVVHLFSPDYYVSREAVQI